MREPKRGCKQPTKVFTGPDWYEEWKCGDVPDGKQEPVLCQACRDYNALLADYTENFDYGVELIEALEFYANPETYHAIAFIPDHPCGDFWNDFSEDHGHWFYKRAMPGDLARTVLQFYPEETE